jgi:hypothetical protein
MIKRYVLEAQRLTLDLPIRRIAVEDQEITYTIKSTKETKTWEVKKGQRFVLQLVPHRLLVF